MFKKLFAAFSAKPKTRADAPYGTEELNTVHNMLFADDVGQLFGEAPDVRVVQAIAQDANEESRVRLLAAQWLRANGQAPAAPEVLGVVIEVPLDGSMDTLAAYADGRVRYINQTGKISVFEGREDLRPLVEGLFGAARTVVAQIGPWDRERLPAPRPGRIRLSFLVSDGLYFGDGVFTEMERDPLAGPVIAQATQLVQRVVAIATA